MKDDELGRAIFIKGSIRIEDAADTSIIGDVMTGFYDYNAYPQYNTLYAWQKVITDVPTEWLCIHHDTKILNVSYTPVSNTTAVPLNSSVLVIEGSITANDQGSVIAVSEMQQLKARPYTYTIDGDAKVLFIQ
jgi:hypothetical protein